MKNTLILSSECIDMERRIDFLRVEISYCGQVKMRGIAVIHRLLYGLLRFFTVLFVFLQLFGELTLTVTVQLWPGFVFTQIGRNIIFIDFEVDIDHYLTERLQERSQEQ